MIDFFMNTWRGRNLIVLFFTALIMHPGSGVSQIQTGKLPPSHTRKASLPEPPVVDMPEVDGQALRRQSRQAPRRKKLHFARVLNVDLDIKKRGDQHPIDQGTIYRLAIRSEGAFSLQLVFGQYRLPPGAELFVYSKKHDHLLGAFTATNNKAGGGLPVAPVKGEEVVIEYYEPDQSPFDGDLVLSKVGHDFLGIWDVLSRATLDNGFGSSGDCNVDIRCPAGDNWQDVKHAVTLVSTLGNLEGILCSGSLINNTHSNGHPYFLTANHCISSQNQLDEAVFYFNYEADSCNAQAFTRDQTLSVGRLLATSPRTDQLDFTLVELSEAIPPTYRPFYAGWSLDTSNITRTTTIHHPSGDAKMITKDDDPPVHATFPDSSYDLNSHWRIKQWDLGTTEGGSSGAPLFNQNKRIIGGLTGGQASCQNNVNDYFAKISRSWDDFGPAPYQLEKWLDPERSRIDRMEGYQPYQSHPSNLTVQIEYPDLKLTWNAPYNRQQVDYYVIARNQQLLDSVDAGTTSFLDNQVEVGRDYRYRVRARLQSGDYTEWSETLAYELWASQILPYGEDFAQADNLPGGWVEQTPGGDTGRWSIAVGGSNNVPSQPANGSFNLLFSSDSGHVSRLVAPRMDLSGGDYPYLTFYRANPDLAGQSDQLRILIRYSDTLPWLPLKDYRGSLDNWQRDTLYLPHPTSQYRLAFEGMSHGGGGIVVDQVQVENDARGFEPTIDAADMRICAGGSTQFQPGVPDTLNHYTWDFGYGAEPRYAEGYGPHQVTYSVPGPKTIQLTINGAYHTRRESLVMVDTLPDKPHIRQNADTLFTDANQSPQWFFQGEPIEGADDDTLVITETGIYRVANISPHGCTTLSDTLHVSGLNAIQPAEQENQRLVVYPNPSKGKVYLEMDSRISHQARLQVINSLGAVVMQQHYFLNPGHNRKTLSVSSLPAGLYLLRLQMSNNRILQGKMVVE